MYLEDRVIYTENSVIYTFHYAAATPNISSHSRLNRVQHDVPTYSATDCTTPVYRPRRIQPIMLGGRGQALLLLKYALLIS